MSTKTRQGAELAATGQPSPAQWPLWSPSTVGALREAIAAYVLSHQDRVRAIARRKLTASARQVFDSEEVVSSVLRRLDGMAMRGSLRTTSEAELWGLIRAIAQNTAVSKTQLIERTRDLLTEEGAYAQRLLERLDACDGDDEATLIVQRMLLSFKDATDRQLLVLIMRGATHKAIGGLLGISEEASRARWKKARDALNTRFAEGLLDG